MTVQTPLAAGGGRPVNDEHAQDFCPVGAFAGWGAGASRRSHRGEGFARVDRPPAGAPLAGTFEARRVQAHPKGSRAIGGRLAVGGKQSELARLPRVLVEDHHGALPSRAQAVIELPRLRPPFGQPCGLAISAALRRPDAARGVKRLCRPSLSMPYVVKTAVPETKPSIPDTGTKTIPEPPHSLVDLNVDSRVRASALLLFQRPQPDGTIINNAEAAKPIVTGSQNAGENRPSSCDYTNSPQAFRLYREDAKIEPKIAKFSKSFTSRSSRFFASSR